MRSNEVLFKSNRRRKRENAGRKPIWNNPDTCTILVPKLIAQKVMQLAHRLDSGEEFDNDTKSNHIKKAAYYMWKPGVSRDGDYGGERCEIWDTGNGKEPLIQTPLGTKLRIKRGNLRPWLGI